MQLPLHIVLVIFLTRFQQAFPVEFRAGPILQCARVFNADGWKEAVEGNAMPCGDAE